MHDVHIEHIHYILHNESEIEYKWEKHLLHCELMIPRGVVSSDPALKLEIAVFSAPWSPFFTLVFG